jgi:hypothetical protein
MVTMSGHCAFVAALVKLSIAAAHKSNIRSDFCPEMHRKSDC